MATEGVRLALLCYVGKDPAGGVGYHTLTGVGMLCNQMWDKGNTRDLRKAADYVFANTRFDYNNLNFGSRDQ